MKENLFQSFIILTLLKISGIRLFNSLNLTMTLVSAGGFLPLDELNDIISTNFQKMILAFSLILSMLSSAAFLPISGLEPAPNPSVSSAPN